MDGWWRAQHRASGNIIIADYLISPQLSRMLLRPRLVWQDMK